MVKRIFTGAAVGALISGQAFAFSFGSAGSGPLQTVLDDITLGGSSSVNVLTDEVPDHLDSTWQIGGSGGAVSTLIIELAGFAPDNKFGIYDSEAPGTQVEVFDGVAAAGSQSVISILADGSVFVNFADTGIDFGANSFGFYLDTQVNQPGVGLWHSDTALNSDGVDHMAAYQGVGDTIQIPPFAAGQWGENEYILAFEDLHRNNPGFDGDYTDFVVLVESINPVPEAGTTVAFFGLALLGIGVVRRKLIT